MVNSLDLAGVIGTWVAAVFAVFALVGIVGPLLLYRATRTDRQLAINAIDDPNHEYTSAGYLLWWSKRFFRRIKAPILTDPPLLKQIDVRRNEAILRGKRSSTGWIMFASALRAYNIGFALGDVLVIDQKESFLPVHRCWLLVLGLIGRYAHRNDYGVDAAPEIIPALPQPFRREYYHDNEGPLYGLTGALLHTQNSLEGLIDRVYFHMHGATQIEGLEADKLSLQTLFYLYMGYLPGSDGLLYYLWVEKSFRFRRDTTKRIMRFTQMSDSDLETSHIYWFRVMGVDVPPIEKLRTYIASEDERSNIERWVDDDESTASPFTDIEQDLYHKSDIHRIALALLELQWSPRSFLQGGNWHRNDHEHTQNVMDMCLYVNLGLTHSIDLSIKVISSLSIGDDDKAELQKTLEQAKHVIDAYSSPMSHQFSHKLSFSRTLTKAYHTLDFRLRTICNTTTLPMQTISTLFITDQYFADHVNNSNLKAPGTLTSTATIDFAHESVNVPASWSSVTRYHFDFGKVYRGTRAAELASLIARHGQSLELPYPEVVIACLQGNLRRRMWDMVLPADDLHHYLDSMDDVVHIAASTKDLRVHNRSHRQRRSRDRRRRSPSSSRSP
ncbi:MAG: hypothetical protein M1816_004098 [Peltula sp. TS41687]|nr:MAG: hypothetical protein M1816_004098 [Peltula sp. TS41687]